MPAGTEHPEIPDRELLCQAAAGDREAFGAIFERYQHVVYRFARAMTGSADAAEDVTQEVFVAFIRDLRRYDPDRASVSTYLYGVARNVSRDRLRRERRFLSLDTLKLATAGCAGDPFTGLAGTQDALRLRGALTTLPSRYREVIILCDLHDLSYATAAVVVRASVGAVRSRLHRGRQLLKQRLAKLERLPARHAVGTARCSV